MAPPRHPAPGTQHGPGTGSGARRSRHVPRRPGAPQRPPARRLLREGGAAARPGPSPGASPSARRDFRFLGAAEVPLRGRGTRGAADGGPRGAAAAGGAEQGERRARLLRRRRAEGEGGRPRGQGTRPPRQGSPGRREAAGGLRGERLGSGGGGAPAEAAGGAVAAQPGPEGRVRGVGAGEPGGVAPHPGHPRQGRRLRHHQQAGSRQLLRARQDVEVTVKRRKARSPAITLLIKNSSAEISVDIILALEVQQSWPPSTQDGLNIERWLGRKVRREFRNKPIYLVAKQNKKEKVPRGNTWRISFSHIEKAMMNNHGSIKTCCETDGAKCCRKDCLKLLKYLLEKLKMKYAKELEKFCSYHVKTAFFHSCVIWPNDTDWQYENLEHCFQNYLGYFLRCLQDSQLPHFFIPQYNLFSPDDKASNHFLSRQINHQLNNRFPIFQQEY
ncbi:cyclic GMP-AMP synthase isoform X1 [Anas acuta]|uniref:cyclic GMP-AMP synthase isoform X1 n=1 Tax=Anas acuta TaxID=28680 RepID=UPI0035C938C8